MRTAMFHAVFLSFPAKIQGAIVSNALRMPFAEWLYRMSEAALPVPARNLAITAAFFNVTSNAELAELAGMFRNGEPTKTFFTWRQFLLTEGWLLKMTSGYKPACGGVGIEIGEMPDDYFCPLPIIRKGRKHKYNQGCSAILREKTRRAFDYTCQHCGFRCAPGQDIVVRNDVLTSAYLTVDRIVPGSKGGRYVENNVTLACRDCNSKRGDKVADDVESLASRTARSP